MIIIIITIIIIIIPSQCLWCCTSSWQSHSESLPGSFDECRTAPSGCRPSDQPRRLGLWVRLYRLPESTPTIAIYYYNSAWKLILILPYHGGQKAESTYLAGYIPWWFTRQQMVTHPGTSSSRMCVMTNNWSAMKQHLHPQSVAKINHHSVLSGTGFDNVRHRLGLATRTQISVCKSPFRSAGTAVSLFRAKTVQQRPLLAREVETRLLGCRVAGL